MASNSPHAMDPVVVEKNRLWFAAQAAGVTELVPVSQSFSFVPDSGISAAAFRPAWTLGTVTFTSVTAT